ncbi:MAG: CPBP family glutamic-type intramembrane protease [Verrucomicrobiota bacterium]|nr:CPBP family glutamic-type intramembrane protease [Verrucomicrobiota bacterium]
MNQDPLIQALFIFGALYIGWLWLKDSQAAARGVVAKGALPGATPCPRGIVWVGALVGVLLCVVAAVGELALGTTAEQSTVAYHYLAVMIAAGFTEELVFRGYLVITGKGRGVLIASCVGFSVLFSLLHAQYYTVVPPEASWTEFTFKITAQSLWTLFTLFLNSLVFYSLRFTARNPRHSLMPCIVAHSSYNLAVFITKLFQGYVDGV